MAKTNEYLGEAYEALKKLSADDKKRLEYEAREKALKDYNTQISSAERRGETRGEKWGEKRRDVKLFRSMKKTMCAEQVSAVTSLELAYIQKIFDLLEKYPKESDEKIASRLILGETSA